MWAGGGGGEVGGVRGGGGEGGSAFPIGLHVRQVKTDQPAHARSLIRVFTWHSVGNQGSKEYSGW